MAPSYLNSELMASVIPEEFRKIKPYPWINPKGFIRPEYYSMLIEEMPTIDKFEKHFGYERQNQQASHDRFILEYRESADVSVHWHEFIGELRSNTYRKFICGLLDVPDISFSFQWHYTPRGASVSPHCDSRRKLGSHIFYLNSEEDWNPDWGGQTLILDDHGKYKRHSNPEIEDFDSIESATIGENRSLVFCRVNNSWHAVRALTCPEGKYRKVFLVRFEKRKNYKSMRKRFINLVKGRKTETAVPDTIF